MREAQVELLFLIVEARFSWGNLQFPDGENGGGTDGEKEKRKEGGRGRGRGLEVNLYS